MALFRGTLIDFDSNTYRARVRLDGSAARTVDAVRAARFDPSEFVPGRRVLIDAGDHGDPNDAVVTAVWE